MTTDSEAALQVAKQLKAKGYDVVNIKNIEADIRAIRERIENEKGMRRNDKKY